MTLLSARHSAGFEAGFGAAIAREQLDRLAVEHADDYASWWAAGQALDAPTTARLALDSIEELRADRAAP